MSLTLLNIYPVKLSHSPVIPFDEVHGSPDDISVKVCIFPKSDKVNELSRIINLKMCIRCVLK